MTRRFRRVVTGHNAEGKSIIWRDGPSPQVLEPLPQLTLHELWETTAPAVNTGETDTAIRENSIEPHDPNGAIFRIVDFPPDEVWKDADVGAAFSEMGSGDAHDDDAETAGMHETQTTDFAIVLNGEIWAVMEEGETMLSAGDVSGPARHQPRLVQPLQRTRRGGFRADRRGTERVSGVNPIRHART